MRNKLFLGIKFSDLKSCINLLTRKSKHRLIRISMLHIFLGVIDLIGIATIGVNGRRSAYAYSTATASSPLVFDFTLSQDVRLASGSIVPNQRFLFLVI